MTIAIAVFARPDAGRSYRYGECRPYSLFNLAAFAGRDADCFSHEPNTEPLHHWPNSRLTDAKALADLAQKSLFADYAVFDLGDLRPGSNCTVPDVILDNPRPLYVARGAYHLAYVLDCVAGEGSPSATVLPDSGYAVLQDGTLCEIGRRPATNHGVPWGRIVWLQPVHGILAQSIPYGAWFCASDGQYAGFEEGRIRARVADAADVSAWEDAGSDAPAPEPVAPVAPAVRFEVRSGLNGTDRDGWGAVHEAESGKAAAQWVAANKATYAAAGKSLVIVRVELEAQAVDWRERERRRLEDGTYTDLPGDWGAIIARAYPDHFAHVAQSDKRKVAFTESEGSGERDKQKVLSASAYVERFFQQGDGWSSNDTYWPQDRRQAFLADMLGDSLNVLFAPLGDEEAMVRVYRDTDGGAAHGCMSYGAGNYHTGGVHPTVVYARGGELTVAFLRGYGDDAPAGESRHSLNPEANWDDDGPILARCLVWIKDGEPQEYGRVYGECDMSRLLRTGLEAKGYRSGDCEGARIAKVPRHGGYIMPYLDIGGGSVTDGGDYWLAGGGDYEANRTDGLMSASPRAMCQHCEESVDEDDIRTVHTSRYDTEEWCEHCCEHGAFHCDELGEHVHVDCAAEVRREGSRWTETVAEWLLEDGTIEAVLTADGFWHEGGFVCDDCGDGFAPSERVDLESATVCTSCRDEREAAEAEDETNDDTGAAVAA